MDASWFIASRLRFKGRVAMVCIATSFLVMIVAVSISSGFRRELRSSLTELSGDVLITRPDMNMMRESDPISLSSPFLSYVEESEYVDGIVPSVWRAGIVRSGEGMHGVILKGTASPSFSSDTMSLAVSIPRLLSQTSGLDVGDSMLTYFVGDDINLRRFTVAQVHDAIAEAYDRHVVYVSLSDMQRLNGWEDDEVSAIEIHLAEKFDSDEDIRLATQEIGSLASLYDPEENLVATSSVSRYPQLFNWLALIDFNVGFILLLMTIVAGFNMISGLLIMLFENISTIGLLKSLGMTDRAIAKVFLSSSAILVGKGMAIGNALALLFCFIQKTTHMISLNPENYYVSSVPVNVDILSVLAADVLSFVVIMLLLLIPCLFISKVDPAQTVRVR